MFQNSDDQLFCPTVPEDVAFGAPNPGRREEQAIQIASATLQSLTLSDFSDCISHKLSGGEKPLLALATVLAMEP